MTAAIAAAAVIVPIIVVLFWIVARWVFRRRIGRGNAPANPRRHRVTLEHIAIGMPVMAVGAIPVASTRIRRTGRF